MSENPDLTKKPLVSPSNQIGGEQVHYQGVEQLTALFKELGLTYIRETIFTEACEVFMETKKSDYVEYNAAPAKAEANIAKYAELIRSHYMAPIYVKWISDAVGYGLFAAQYIPAGALIGEYAGVVTPRADVMNRTWSWKYPIKGKFIDGLPQKVSLNGGEYGNELRFINHSDDRNTSPVFVYNGTTWVNCYYARKPIAKGQELLVNYGKRYWKTRTKVDL